jgi:hypothetical protein
MPRKVVLESDKARTTYSDLVMADVIVMGQLEHVCELAAKSVSGDGIDGLAAIRDTCEVMVKLAWEKRLNDQQAELEALRAKLQQ